MGGLRKDIDEAVGLVREPGTFFTRAQVIAVTIQLMEQYSKYFDGMNLAVLLDTALDDLETAFSLGMPARFFTEDRADELMIAGLWNQAEGRQRLAGLRR